ncbi:FAD-dependent oxidoreductase [Phycicoccus sp. BSK3Z-2]|uniref:FAD-dependent oxidoreductase n=1 Tax=Phycicoccus avicenniae TaxID=2828860 RepID=A0A941D5B5_9MICO|nr:FAD-dependent oxidoreductase [Phycicoccus avicenniae]MBR7741838.1 FAD-dependent oxidoreductase [Phycicoccus avicenniae]
MREETLEADIAVVGGGLAGVSAAIGAARQGARVVLVQNRPVLGGNSSSEVRVWVCGATAHGVHPFARETGIMGELFVENQYRNPEGNPYYWDLLLLEKVRAEDNITLLLNTEITDVDAHGGPDRRVIRSIAGWVSGSERRVSITASSFVECSGDGLVGYLAGASFASGRESRSMYREPSAPEVPDSNTLGSTILFHTKDVGRPSKFVPPPFAVDIRSTAIPRRREISHEMNGCDFWWIEWGGELDVLHDNETIRDELHAVVYGLWDYIKNSGEFPAENLSLEWVGSVPGKREYRRFFGDHVLVQSDIMDQTEFADRVAFGGWSIDLHPPGGVYASEPGSRHLHPDGNYHIPLRSLFSVNVENLWLAGRTISASHVAFGSTRVMATCATLGEAAGIAAATALRLDVTPRNLSEHHVKELHHAMVRADASLLGVENTDARDLALSASASASSSLVEIAHDVSTRLIPLDDDYGLVVPVDPALDGLDLLLDADEDTSLVVEVHTTSKPQNYLPSEQVGSATVRVGRGRSWTHVPVVWHPASPCNAFVVIRANRHLRLHAGASSPPGSVTLSFRPVPPAEPDPTLWRHWKQVLLREGLCFKLGTTEAFSPRQVLGGFARPYGGPNMWASDDMARDPEPTVTLAWDEHVRFREIDLIFDDDLNEDLINLHHHRTPDEIMPTLVRRATLDVLGTAGWQQVAAVEDNRVRRCSITLDSPVLTDRLRVRVHETNGCRQARIVAVRVFDTPSGVPGAHGS